MPTGKDTQTPSWRPADLHASLPVPCHRLSQEVAFSTDGAYAATASYDGTVRTFGCSNVARRFAVMKCEVRIWNSGDGSLVQHLEGPSKERCQRYRKPGPAFAMALRCLREEIEWILWHPKGGDLAEYS